jgi:glycerophosphoryl diester phosphodiesterase
VQLIDSAHGVPTAVELEAIRAYADAIGPSVSLIYRGMGASGPVLTSLIGDARGAGLAVHAYTFRRDDLPAGIGSFDDLLMLFVGQLEVDGLFTDFPDLVVRFIDERMRS